MSAAMFAVTLTATAEVRDKDGNLISSTPVEVTQEMTEDDLRAHRLTDEQIDAIKRGDN